MAHGTHFPAISRSVFPPSRGSAELEGLQPVGKIRGRGSTATRTPGCVLSTDTHDLAVSAHWLLCKQIFIPSIVSAPTSPALFPFVAQIRSRGCGALSRVVSYSTSSIYTTLDGYVTADGGAVSPHNLRYRDYEWLLVGLIYIIYIYIYNNYILRSI